MEIKTWKDLIPIKQIVFTDDETDFSKEALEEMLKLEKLQKHNEGNKSNQPIFYGIEVWMLYKDGDYDVDCIASSLKYLPESVPPYAERMNWENCDAIKLKVPYDNEDKEYDEILLVRKSKVM